VGFELLNVFRSVGLVDMWMWIWMMCGDVKVSHKVKWACQTQTKIYLRFKNFKIVRVTLSLVQRLLIVPIDIQNVSSTTLF
jgi:hypothetical protein